MKVHFLYRTRNLTDCGIQAFLSKNTDTEADVWNGNRIEVTWDDSKVTCGSCRKVRKLPRLARSGPAQHE